MKIDVNADVGEGYPYDEGLMPIISSANIACGFHAGNTDSILKTINLCVKHGVAIGAHPSFLDKENFGRKNMLLSTEELQRLVLRQLEVIHLACLQLGATFHHVKPHGALYNQSAAHREVATCIAETVYAFNPNLKLYGLSGSYSITEGKMAGLQTVSEVFADRSYEDDGSLTPRNMPNAVHGDVECIIEQAVSLAMHQQVVSKRGKPIGLLAESICLHGDTPKALSYALAIHKVFTKLGISIESIH